MALPERSFATQLRAFSRAELVTFLVELWEARGWEVERTADVLVLYDPETGSVKRLYPLRSDANEFPSDDLDIVVDVTGSGASDCPAAVTLLDPASIYQMVNYAIAPDVGEELLRTHFDRDRFGAGDGVDATGAEGHSTTGDEASEGATDSAAAPTGPPVRPDDERGDSQPPEHTNTTRKPTGETAADASSHSDSAAASAEDDPAESRPLRTSRRAVLVGGGAVFGGLSGVAATTLLDGPSSIAVPGLTENGVDDPTALAETHARVLTNRSYSLLTNQVDYEAAMTLRSYLSMNLQLAVDRSFLTRVATAGPRAPNFLGNPPSARVYWSDGIDYISKTPGGGDDVYRSFEPTGYVGTWEFWAKNVPFGGTPQSQAERYFRVAFEEIPTRLVERRDVGTTTIYRIGNRGQPSSDISLSEVDASAVRTVDLDAEITPEGAVRSFTLRFTSRIAGKTVHSRRDIEYRAIGDTTVDRPGWYERAVDS